jgi:hypothetical protein
MYAFDPTNVEKQVWGQFHACPTILAHHPWRDFRWIWNKPAATGRTDQLAVPEIGSGVSSDWT